MWHLFNVNDNFNPKTVIGRFETIEELHEYVDNNNIKRYGLQWVTYNGNIESEIDKVNKYRRDMESK